MYDRKLVLLVGDHPDLATQAHEVLGHHRVLMVHSGEVAREVLFGGRVDCVLLGPDLASEAGMALARDLMTLEPGVPVALCAGIVTNRVLLQALRAGLADVVELPLRSDSLQRIVDVPPATPEVVIVMERAVPVEAPLRAVPPQAVTATGTEHSTPGEFSALGATAVSEPSEAAEWSEARERPVA